MTKYPSFYMIGTMYKYSEDKTLAELKDYIDGTYDQHYASGKIQSTEFIIDAGHGLGFAVGNIIKYAQRYGKKAGYNKKDLMKVIHYAIIALSIHERDHENIQENA